MFVKKQCNVYKHANFYHKTFKYRKEITKITVATNLNQKTILYKQ